ncbi:Uncharacterised protein [uncultured archaeon]|nr:Uncharacterised protein [uncultured archaeon]
MDDNSYNFGPAEKQRLQDVFNDGVKTLEEIDTLKNGFTDTIDAVSQELNIPKTLLGKAIKIAFKGDYSAHEQELETIDKIISAAGKK